MFMFGSLSYFKLCCRKNCAKTCTSDECAQIWCNFGLQNVLNEKTNEKKQILTHYDFKELCSF